MNTASAILFSTLIFSTSSMICDAPGICERGHLDFVDALDSFDCWRKCMSYNGCNYASFMPCFEGSDNCWFHNDCPKLDTTCYMCPDFSCRTSSMDCPQCDFSGLCIVSKNLS